LKARVPLAAKIGSSLLQSDFFLRQSESATIIQTLRVAARTVLHGPSRLRIRPQGVSPSPCFV
jgi:hypothetical protein